MKQVFNLISLIGVVLFFTSCATPPIGSKGMVNINNHRFVVQNKGKIKLVLKNKYKSLSCSSRGKLIVKGKSKNKANVAIAIYNSKKQLVEKRAITCNKNKALTVKFKKKYNPGKYRSALMGGKNLKYLKGKFLFNPNNKNYNSGPDKAFQGANPIEEGVNKGELHIGTGDSTDWWRVQSEGYAKYSILFQTKDDKKHMGAVGVYKVRDGRLSKVTILYPNKGRTLNLEGKYFFKVEANPYTDKFKYSLSMVNMTGEKVTKSGGDKSVVRSSDVNVMDFWPLGSSKTAVLLRAGKTKEIKKGDGLKIFKNGQFYGVCTIVNVSSQESECHVKKSIEYGSKIKARRTL